MLRMLKNNYSYVLIILSSISFMLIQLFNEQNENISPLIFTLIGLLFIPLLIGKIERALDLIILFAPISIPILLPFVNTKISIPSELISAFIVIVFLIKAFFGLSIRKDIFKHPITIILFLDLLWTFITALTSSNIDVSIKRFVLKSTFVFVYYYLFSNFYYTTNKQHKIFLFYGIGLIIPIIYAFMDSIKLGFGQASSFVIGQPFFSDHTIYGACLAFILPFYLLHAKKQNRLGINLSSIIIPLLIIIFAAEIQSYSRASWISLIVCLLFYLATKFKIKGYQLASGLFIITLVFLLNFQSIYQGLRESEAKYDDNVGAHLTSVTNLQSDASNLERINRWVCAYRMFEERPLLGFGPGTYQFEYDKFQTPEFMTRISTHQGNRGNAHSEYLTYLSETGLPGLIIYILLIIYTIYLSLKLIYSNINSQQKKLVYGASLGLITFFTHGLFNTFSDYEKMSVLIYGALSILVSIDISTKKEKRRIEEKVD